LYLGKGRIKRIFRLCLIEFFDKGEVMQSYPTRALDRRFQEDWVRDAKEGPRVFMSLRVDYGPMG